MLLVWFGIFFARKIDLTTADIGRHIKNGEILLRITSGEKLPVLRQNFYSYTMPDAPFVNHHWGSGILFYVVWKSFGFVGLSLFYVLLGLTAVFLFWDIARRASNCYVASFLTIVLLPLIVSRSEIRPEVFTYLFSGMFFWSLYSKKYIWILPVLATFWVNLHIGFVFSFLVLGVFCFEELLKFLKKKPNNFKKMTIVSVTSVATSLINPFGYKALIYPFEIFKNYGYKIVENQSIGFLEGLGFNQNMHFLLFKIIAFFVAISFALLFAKRMRISIAMFLLIVVSGVMGYLSIKQFPLFAFFALQALSYNLYHLYVNISESKKAIVLAGASVLFVTALAFQIKDFIRIKPVLGFGLLPGVNVSSNFLKINNIKGPIFNNYDVGGYLIYHFYPQEKVFIDNRPEAYSEEFFQKMYIPAQEENKKWLRLEQQYNFNVIFFSHRDYTPWGQKFLIERVNDKNWVPVFADSYNIIFLKRNAKNTDLIKKFEIPKERFGTSSNQR